MISELADDGVPVVGLALDVVTVCLRKEGILKLRLLQQRGCTSNDDLALAESDGVSQRRGFGILPKPSTADDIRSRISSGSPLPGSRLNDSAPWAHLETHTPQPMQRS